MSCHRPISDSPRELLPLCGMVQGKLCLSRRLPSSEFCRVSEAAIAVAKFLRKGIHSERYKRKIVSVLTKHRGIGIHVCLKLSHLLVLNPNYLQTSVNYSAGLQLASYKMQWSQNKCLQPLNKQRLDTVFKVGEARPSRELSNSRKTKSNYPKGEKYWWSKTELVGD